MIKDEYLTQKNKFHAAIYIQICIASLAGVILVTHFCIIQPKGTGETILNGPPDSQLQDQLSGMQEIQSDKNAISVTRSDLETLSPQSYPSTYFK